MPGFPNLDLKEQIHDFWNAESCGSRYLEGESPLMRFRSHSEARYRMEPFIPRFAGFEESNGKQVLEVGVGLGADFVRWLQGGAHATGVDLTPAAIEQTRERAALEGFNEVKLRVADAEDLPFDDNSFDIVYSWGVLHHTPNTQTAIDEVHRVLKPGGRARVMIYRHPSWVAAMLWTRHGLLKGRPLVSVRDLLAQKLESPGTQAFVADQAQALFERFDEVIRFEPQLGPADTLEVMPSSKYQGGFYRLVWALWPRWLIRLIGNRMGLYWLVEVRK